MKWSRKSYMFFFVSLYIVTCTWIGMEYIIDGKVTPRDADNVILVILCYLITDKINNHINKVIK